MNDETADKIADKITALIMCLIRVLVRGALSCVAAKSIQYSIEDFMSYHFAVLWMLMFLSMTAVQYVYDQELRDLTQG